MSPLSRFRERLVLGHVRGSLEDGERILAWAHAKVPGVRAPGVVLVTEQRCLVHVASSQVADRTSAWTGVHTWRLERPAGTRARLTLIDEVGESVGELSLTSRRRARAASGLLQAISRCAPVPCDGDAGLGRAWPGRAGSPPHLDHARRGLRGQVRRVAVTVVGVLVLLLSLLFASPFFPGPGALTAVAGIAILASEYEWARDLHVWASRQLERFVAWLRRRKEALKQRRRPTDGDGDGQPAATATVRKAA